MVGYEATELLLKCGADDFSMLISQIDSYVSFTSDTELKELLTRYKNDPSTSKISADIGGQMNIKLKTDEMFI